MVAELARSPLRHVTAVAAVVCAAVTVRRLYRACSFDVLLRELRARPAWPRARAREELRVASRMVALLPPWSMGRCIKRSLILLHLWSGRGLEPRLHLGVRRRGGVHVEGHAWLSVGDPELALLLGTPDSTPQSFEL